MATRATRTFISLSIACLLLSACDMADVLQLADGGSAQQEDAGAKASADPTDSPGGDDAAGTDGAPSSADGADGGGAPVEPAESGGSAPVEPADGGGAPAPPAQDDSAPAQPADAPAADEPSNPEPSNPEPSNPEPSSPDGAGQQGSAPAEPPAGNPPAADAPATPSGNANDVPPPSSSCNHVIGRGVDEADGRSNYSGVRPGDTVCISAGTRGPLDLNNFHGAPGRTITFVNHGGPVNIRGDGGDYAGIKIENSDHIRVTGAGEHQQCGATAAAGDQRCGIRILGSARSLTGKVKTEYIQVDHVEMGNTTQSAVSIKDNSMGRGEWVEHDVVLNHNYIHDVKDEGVYVGSSDYATGDYHVLNGVHLGHNLVVNTGRDGLQVGSTTADCTIHHNVIRNTGRNNESSHRAGVMNNKGSVCDVYNNAIADTAGWGIYVQGNGGNEIYNNVILRAGRSVKSGDGDGDGISIHDGSNVKRSIAVWNNTVVSARGDGIGWSNDVGSDNQIRNNIVVASGGANIDKDPNVDVSRNLAAQSIAAARFVAAGSDDYRLRSDSPAVDAGASLSARGVLDDHDGVPRPQGSAYDIGAHELGAP